MEKLTTVQLKALTFIKSKIEATGSAPTLREMCQHMGYSAVGSAQDLISALRRKGFLEEPTKQSARAMIPTMAGRDILSDDEKERDPMTLVLPCLGSVPAGNPVEAVEERIGTLRMSTSMLPKSVSPGEPLFALKAKGESMIGAGILDGDWLVVWSQNTAPNGSIVVARVDGGDATVKRLVKDKSRGWYLKPENPSFKPVYAEDRSFEVIGRVVALQRGLV